MKGKAMKVYLVQHGEAVPEDVGASRPLSEKGRHDVEKIANFLEDIGVGVSKILHSGKTRALQTAEIIYLRINVSRGIAKKDGLFPNDEVDPILHEIAEEIEDTMMVGHLPFLSKLASKLLGVPESANIIAFQQGGVACLERGEGNRWSLKWMVTPHLIMQPAP
jgi:phosphohistidine phosphatase